MEAVAEFRTQYHPYAVKFCPIEDGVVLVVTAQNTIDFYNDAARVPNLGGGRLHVLAHDPDTNVLAETRRFETPAGLYDCSWSNDDTFAATAGADGLVRIYDTYLNPTANPIRTIPAHLYDVRSVDWNTHFHGRILSASTDGSVKQWDIERATDVIVRTFGDQRLYNLRFGAFYSVHWNPLHHELFASGSSYLFDAARVFDVRLPGNNVDSAVVKLRHPDIVVFVHWNGGFLATSSIDGRVRVWDVRNSNAPVTEHEMVGFAGRSKVRFVPAHESAFLTCSGTRVDLWDHRRDPALMRRFEHHEGQCTVGVDASKLARGLMASTGLDDKVVVWRCTDWPTKSSARIKAMAERAKGSGGSSLDLSLGLPGS